MQTVCKLNMRLCGCVCVSDFTTATQLQVCCQTSKCLPVIVLFGTCLTITALILNVGPVFPEWLFVVCATCSPVDICVGVICLGKKKNNRNPFLKYWVQVSRCNCACFSSSKVCKHRLTTSDIFKQVKSSKKTFLQCLVFQRLKIQFYHICMYISH